MDLGDYPCIEDGFPTGERCSDPACGRTAGQQQLRALYALFFSAASTEPTTWDVVEEVQRIGQEITDLEALLDRIG